MAWVTKSSSEQYNRQPEPERQYTKRQKAANWWDYHKWQLILGAAFAALAVWIVSRTLLQTKPDLEVGFVGSADLPVDTAEALSSALAAYCTDLNGDGKVVVQLNQYTVSFDEADASADAYYQMAGTIQLSADLDDDSVYLFLLEDPAGFESATGALQYLDGTVPADTDDASIDWREMVYRWTDCPVLTSLELGSYTGRTVMDTETGESQDVLAGLYVARRGVWTEEQAESEALRAGAALWAALTEGAVSTAGAAQ